MGTRQQAIHLPKTMLTEIDERAKERALTASELVESAWSVARPLMAKKRSDHPSSPRAQEGASKRHFALAPMTLAEITEEAARLDRSLSWIVREAWICASVGLETSPIDD